MPFYAYWRKSRDPFRFDTKAAFHKFIDSLTNLQDWWFTAKTDPKEQLAHMLAEMAKRRKKHD